MGNALSMDLRVRFKRLMDGGMRAAEAGRVLLLSPATAARWGNKIRNSASWAPRRSGPRKGSGKLAPFFRHPAVQGLWRDAIGLTFDIRLEPGLSDGQVIERVFRPWVAALAQEARPVHLSSVSAFTPDGAHYGDGVKAIRIAYIPLIALGFSLLGGGIHLFKTAGFALKTALGQKTERGRKLSRAGTLFLLALIIGGAAWVSQRENPVTQSDLFLRFEVRTAEMAGKPLATLMRAVIQLQSFSYPVSEAIRSRLLLGLTFDFDPDTGTPLLEVFPEFDQS